MSEYSEAYSRPVKASRHRNTSDEKQNKNLMIGLDFGERFISEIHRHLFVCFVRTLFEAVIYGLESKCLTLIPDFVRGNWLLKL